MNTPKYLLSGINFYWNEGEKMKNQPKVTIIVPVYNVEEYLVKCLDSLVNQTLKEIEIICINDGSTDNSLEILNTYTQKDKRVIVIDKKNEGQGIARNLGITQANGEYIGFVDPDDWVSSDMYEKMYNQAKELNSEIVVCDFIKYQDWTGRSWKHEFWIQSKSNCQYENLEVPSGVNLDKDYIFKSIIISPCYAWNKIYKTEFLKLNNIKFSEARCFEDCIFIIDAMLQAKNISYVDSEFYIYRLRMSSTLRSLNNIEQESLNVFKEIYNAFKKYNLLNKLEQNLKFFYTMHSIWTMEKLDLQQQKEFLTTLKTVIPNDCYKLVKKKTLKLKYKKLLNFANKIFYITNKDRHKVINICGLKIKFEYYKKEQAKKEHDYINRIEREHKKYHKNCYLLFDCLQDETVECIDAYSLFKYMKSIGKKAYYVVLEDSELYKQLERQDDLKYIISLKNSTLTNPGDFLEEVFPVLLQCKAIITSFGENSHVTNRFFKNNPHWQYIFIQHGQVLMPDRVFKTEYLYPEKFDKFLVSSENEYNIFKKYGWQDDKLLKAGLPRWDLLSERKQKERSILIMFTWRRHNLLSFEESLYKKNLLVS